MDIRPNNEITRREVFEKFGAVSFIAIATFFLGDRIKNTLEKKTKNPAPQENISLDTLERMSDQLSVPAEQLRPLLEKLKKMPAGAAEFVNGNDGNRYKIQRVEKGFTTFREIYKNNQKRSA